MAGSKVPFFVKQDWDGFFGLFIDNLVQLLVIAELTTAMCGIPRAFVYATILPAAAISIIVGNLYYAFQARGVAKREGRDDVTALPYGINTPSVFAFVFFIMAPVYQEALKANVSAEDAWRQAWQIGLIACIGSGLIEFFGAFVAERVRRATPRAALISALAGIAIGFISMDFVLRVFEHPLLAMIPMGIILMQYFSGVRLPFGAPAGLAALIIGTALGWGIKGLTMWGFATNHLPAVAIAELQREVSSMPTSEAFWAAIKPDFAWSHVSFASFAEFTQSISAVDAIFEFCTTKLGTIKRFLPVIIPMGLFNLIGSLQNIESAEAAGDKFKTAPSLAVNGLGTLVAALLGSCFPTTIYIGHVGWKRLGARTGYSILNGCVIAFLCIFGLIGSISVLIPVESVVGILVWIAIIISAQAFQSTPRRHAPAVALGLLPGIAALILLFFKYGLLAGGKPLEGWDIAGLAEKARDARVGGLIALERGFILSSMGLSAMGVMMIERRFKAAAGWAWVLAALSFFGVIHAWNPLNMAEASALGLGTGWRFAIAYAAIGAILFSLRRTAELAGMNYSHGLELLDDDLPGGRLERLTPPPPYERKPEPVKKGAVADAPAEKPAEKPADKPAAPPAAPSPLGLDEDLDLEPEKNDFIEFKGAEPTKPASPEPPKAASEIHATKPAPAKPAADEPPPPWKPPLPPKPSEAKAPIEPKLVRGFALEPSAEPGTPVIARPDETPKPVEAIKPAEAPKPDAAAAAPAPPKPEAPRPAETPKPAEPTKPVEAAKPIEPPKATEPPKPVEAARPAEPAKPASAAPATPFASASPVATGAPSTPPIAPKPVAPAAPPPPMAAANPALSATTIERPQFAKPAAPAPAASPSPVAPKPTPSPASGPIGPAPPMSASAGLGSILPSTTAPAKPIAPASSAPEPGAPKPGLAAPPPAAPPPTTPGPSKMAIKPAEPAKPASVLPSLAKRAAAPAESKPDAPPASEAKPSAFTVNPPAAEPPAGSAPPSSTTTTTLRPPASPPGGASKGVLGSILNLDPKPKPEPPQKSDTEKKPEAKAEEEKKEPS